MLTSSTAQGKATLRLNWAHHYYHYLFVPIKVNRPLRSPIDTGLNPNTRRGKEHLHTQGRGMQVAFEFDSIAFMQCIERISYHEIQGDFMQRKYFSSVMILRSSQSWSCFCNVNLIVTFFSFNKLNIFSYQPNYPSLMILPRHQCCTIKSFWKSTWYIWFSWPSAPIVSKRMRCDRDEFRNRQMVITSKTLWLLLLDICNLFI